MTNRERILVYGGLLLLACLIVPVALQRAGPAALADQTGADQPPKAHSIAFVHVGRAVGPLLEQERYLEERQRLDEEIRETDAELLERLEAFREEFDPNDPQDEQRRRELAAESEQWQRQRAMRMEQLMATQIEQAYRELVAAVDVVAERRDIDVVFRFIPTDNEFGAADRPSAFLAIRSRIALRYPEAMDITDAVLEELALPL